MVWGWVEPSSFGDYFPNGDYVGWDEATKRYFDEEMSAEQRAAFDNWHVRYQGQVASKFSEDKGLLEPHEWPSEFRIMERAPKSLGFGSAHGCHQEPADKQRPARRCFDR